MQMDRGYKGIGMEGRIADWYARNTARDMSDFAALAQRVTATLPPGRSRAAFKNFSQPVDAMNEMYRLLKPGGRALIVDLRSDASMDDLNAYIRQSGVGWANSLIYRATFRYLLLPRAYSREQFVDMASKSAFAGARIDASGIGFEVSLRKKATLSSYSLGPETSRTGSQPMLRRSGSTMRD